MTHQPRILVLGELGPDGIQWLDLSRANVEIVRVDSWSKALTRLRQEQFDVFLANPTDTSLINILHRLLQAERILATMGDGVALVDTEFDICWTNPTFEQWCGATVLGQNFYEALGCESATPCPLKQSLKHHTSTGQHKNISGVLHCRGERAIELIVTPVADPGQEKPLLLALGRDVTQLLQQQQQLDALHQAGQKLASLSAEYTGELSPEQRIELLKTNILRLMHDLFKYESIEIRLLETETGKLVPLLQEGMTDEAAGRVLHADAEESGVTGRVAATRKSYVCSDNSKDPFYIPGAPGARSSLTVPLLFEDHLIGTLNVESTRKRAFSQSDVRFAETFAREIAAALRSLELLSAELHTAASQSLDAVSREVALPVDEILTNTTALLERYIGHEPELADRLKKVLASARSIKECIQRVGEKLPAGHKMGVSTTEDVPSRLKGLRILVVDNDERVRRSAHSLLGRWGCVVETAGDGREALTMARLSNYDAILTDIRLPDLGGFEVYSELCKAQPDADVLLMTGYGYDPSHTIVKARQNGLRHVLYKPFRVDQLLNAFADPVPNSEQKPSS